MTNRYALVYVCMYAKNRKKQQEQRKNQIKQKQKSINLSNKHIYINKQNNRSKKQVLRSSQRNNNQSIKERKKIITIKQRTKKEATPIYLSLQKFNQKTINKQINQTSNRALSSQERNRSPRKQTYNQTNQKKKEEKAAAQAKDDILTSVTERKQEQNQEDNTIKQASQHRHNNKMDQSPYYLQHQEPSSQQGGATQSTSSTNYQSTGMAGYPQGHQMSHLSYQNPHAPYPNHMTGPIDYSVHPPNAPPTGPYHPSAQSHYPAQLHHGYSHPQDPYMQQPYSQAPYEYDPTGQIGGLYYGTPNTVPLSSDPTGQIASNGQQLQATGPYGTYPGQLPPPGHYQQNLGLDPNAQQPPYGQYHPHHSAHHHPGAAFGTTPGQQIDQNYMAFGQQGQYHGPPGNGYMPFGQPLPNGQLHHHNPYGLIQNQNQIGIIDSANQTRPPQSSIGKASIKNEEQAMENELHLLNSLGDSQSQQEDKIKQGGSNYLISSSYDQQPPYPYYLSNQQYGIQKKDDLMAQNQYFQGYPQYATGQYPPGSQQSIPSLTNAVSQTSIKDKDDPSKRQPNSPGRRKTIKKGSPTGNTEPSSPASPRGRKRKNTAKLDQPQPESNPTISQGIINQQQQQQQQFGLHLVKVSNQDQQKNMGYPTQPYYQPVNPLGKVMIDPNTQHISGIDQNSLQRLKELPTDFNMNEFTAVYDDQKQIGSISKEERKQKIKNYQDKRKRRSWQKKISYDVRKKVADGRLRVKGRFVTKKQAMEMLSINGKEEDYTMDQLKEMLKQQGIQANGGEEDSKSPTLNIKNKSQPGTIVSLKPGDDDDDEDGYGSVHSEELPPNEILPIVRGKSCENISNKDDYFQNEGDFNYQNMVQGNLVNNNNSNNNVNSNNNNLNENQLHLKLEQKEIESKQIQQLQFQQLQNQQSYSSQTQSQSQSPVRSPKKQNNNGGFQQVNNAVKFMEQGQGLQMQNLNQMDNNNNINNTNGHSSYADLQNGESPQHSQNNILSQEMADQFGNLNIKSPDQKQKIMQQKNNPQLLNLNQTEQQFFGNNQAAQNQYLYNQQYNNSNNAGYPIHQQQ